MFYLTGDTHGNFKRILYLAQAVGAKQGDICCILGDSGMNFIPGERNDPWKKWLAQIPFTLFIIQGNHDSRPEKLKGIRTGHFLGGEVWYEPAFPKIIYAKNGEIYNLGGKKAIVLGGAYSVDKWLRIERGGLEPGSPWSWHADEQMTDEERARAFGHIRELEEKGEKIDYVLSHTVPRSCMPHFPEGSGKIYGTIDYASEDWLQKVYEHLYRDWVSEEEKPIWYAGHYHMNEKIGDVQILFKSACRLGEYELIGTWEE